MPAGAPGPAFAANAFYASTSNHPVPALERRRGASESARAVPQV